MSSSAALRTLEVPTRRIEAWCAGFTARHGGSGAGAGTDECVTAADGVSGSDRSSGRDGDRLVRRLVGADGCTATVTALGPAAGDSPVGVVIVRRAGYMVARLDAGRVVGQHTGRRHIHGRTAAGGWSQQRYARRRANQADDLVDAVVARARAILLDTTSAPTGATATPGRDRPLGVRSLVTGGDRALLTQTLDDPALRALRTVPVVRHIAAPTPDRDFAAGLPDLVWTHRIVLDERPHSGAAPG